MLLYMLSEIVECTYQECWGDMTDCLHITIICMKKTEEEIEEEIDAIAQWYMHAIAVVDGCFIIAEYIRWGCEK